MVLRYLFLALAFTSTLLGKEPVALYLTMQHCPESTMTICWLEEGSSKQARELKYKNTADNIWNKVSISSRPLPFCSSYQFYTFEMEHLKTDSRYEFVLSNDDSSYFFSTLPKQLNRPVEFIVGGDIYHDRIDLVEEMNRIAAAFNPDFAIIGGDIAYASSKLFFMRDDIERWVEFLKAWSKTMVKSNGDLIPLVSVIGNHDVNGKYEESPDQAPIYYFLFPTEEKSYRSLNFGDYLSLYLLDSGHTHPVEGAQTRWLTETLKQSSEVPYKFAIYHIPAYPSVRSFSNERSLMVRRCWSPIFEAFSITAAFEHHDHAYKRTYPIRDGKRDSKGVLYLGDGAWGVKSPRRPRSPAQSWYLAKTAQTRHIFLVTVQKAGVSFQAINNQGKVFDSFTR